MDVQNGNNKRYVFSIEAINKAVTELTRNPTHEHVPGYLAVLRAHAKNGGSPARAYDIAEVYDRYLRIAGASDGYPYVRAFMSRGKGLKLSNKNVAGSYAISNRRSGGPFFQVVDVTGDKRETEYRLNNDHARLASSHLLQGNKLPITALTIFIYRDYGFDLESRSISTVVGLFCKEFGLIWTESTEKNVFDKILYDDSSLFSDSDLVELQEQSNG